MVRINIVKELSDIYDIQKKRMEILKKMESDAGLPLPEMRENLKLMVDILFKMSDLGEMMQMTVEEKKWDMLEGAQKHE